ncbi:MAG: hypothetical protein ACYSWZ_09465 [Planctomycetota bacterium]|jgi:hypothetical protein
MDWLEVLSIWVKLMVIMITILFALIGIGSVYGDYRESKRKEKWQKKYGDKQAKIIEKIRLTEWEKIEQLRDKLFLFEEVTKDNGFESSIDKINRIISEVNYEARYNSWKIYEGIRTRVCTLGLSEKQVADRSEYCKRYEEQIRQELRMKLRPASY